MQTADQDIAELFAAIAHLQDAVFAGEVQLQKSDPSSSRFGIWANTLTLIADPGAPHSLPTAASVNGTSGALGAQQAVTVTVRGPAGALDTASEAWAAQRRIVGGGGEQLEAQRARRAQENRPQ